MELLHSWGKWQAVTPESLEFLFLTSWQNTVSKQDSSTGVALEDNKDVRVRPLSVNERVALCEAGIPKSCKPAELRQDKLLPTLGGTSAWAW